MGRLMGAALAAVMCVVGFGGGAEAGIIYESYYFADIFSDSYYFLGLTFQNNPGSLSGTLNVGGYYFADYPPNYPGGVYSYTVEATYKKSVDAGIIRGL